MALIQTIYPPVYYAPEQIRRALDIFEALRRGKLVLVERPALLPTEGEER